MNKKETILTFPKCYICKQELVTDFARNINGQTCHFCKECSSKYQFSVEQARREQIRRSV